MTKWRVLNVPGEVRPQGKQRVADDSGRDGRGREDQGEVSGEPPPGTNSAAAWTAQRTAPASVFKRWAPTFQLITRLVSARIVTVIGRLLDTF